MTTIAAYTREGAVAVAADTMVINSWSAHVSACKMVRRSPWIFASSGPTRVKNALRTLDDQPWPEEEHFRSNSSMEAWLCRVFMPKFKVHMSVSGSAVVGGLLGGEGDAAATVLVAGPGVIFTVESDWSVDLWADMFSESRENTRTAVATFAAIGTGQKAALGAMHTMESMRIANPKRIGPNVTHTMVVEAALRAATAYDPWTNDKISIVECLLPEKGPLDEEENS